MSHVRDRLQPSTAGERHHFYLSHRCSWSRLLGMARTPRATTCCGSVVRQIESLQQIYYKQVQKIESERPRPQHPDVLLYSLL